MLNLDHRLGWTALALLVLGACSSESLAPTPDAVVENDSAGVDPSEAEVSASLTVPEGDPGLLGPHPVSHTQLTIMDPSDPMRALKTEVWYPAAGADGAALTTYVIGSMGPLELELDSDHVSRDAAAAPGPWPLVIFSHGYGGISTQSLDLCERLASHGFVVASPAHAGNTAGDDFDETSVPREEAAADRPRDVRTLIDTFTDVEGLPEQLVGLVDPARIGVTGHSYGGYTALSAAAGHAASEMPAEPRVKAIAPISPGAEELSDAELATITIPMLFVAGTLDTATPIDPHVTRPYALAQSAHRVRVDVEGATHTHFANICTIGDALIEMGLAMDSWEAVGAGALLAIYEETCGEDAYPIDEAIRLQCHYVVSFFRTHLAGEPEWEAYLTAGYAAACEPDVTFFSEGETSGVVAPPCLH